MCFAGVFEPGETTRERHHIKQQGEVKQGARPLSAVLRDEVPVMENRPLKRPAPSARTGLCEQAPERDGNLMMFIFKVLALAFILRQAST